MRYAPFALGEDLESHLGDPRDPEKAFSFARCAALDAGEEFPDEICRGLDRWGLPRYYVPARYGGGLVSYEQPLHLLRTLARRDLTVAIAHGKTFLGAVCGWVAAEPAQAERLARLVLDGAVVSWGLTEREHGSDLLAGQVRGEPVPGGYRVTGTKWLINNATRSDLVSVLARTDPSGGTRGFDVLLVDKRALGEGSHRCLPKIRTLGIRGADISGVAFEGAMVPADALVGAPGTGMETVLKSLQLTRTLCGALSLGAADHALRIAVRFARDRAMYGRRLIELPRARRVLVNAYADHLLAEAVVLVAARSVHALPAEMSVTAAVTKYLVPTRTERMIAELGRLLGARSVLTDGTFADGMFQKIARDHRIVPLFDGSTVVNLKTIINEFPLLVRHHRRGGINEDVGLVVDLAADLPALAPAKFSLVTSPGVSVLRSMRDGVARLEKLAAGRPALAELVGPARRMEQHVEEVHARIAGQRPTNVHIPTDGFLLAERYAVCFAAAAALGLWLGTHAHAEDSETGDLWRDGHWLRVVLLRLLAALGDGGPADTVAEAALMASIDRQERTGRLFSLLPGRLAEGLEC